MLKKYTVLFLTCILILIKGSTTLAIDFIGYDSTDSKKFAIGVEIPDFDGGYSITGTYNLIERIALQGIICIGNGSVNYPGVKIFYRFFENTRINLYVYGTWRESQGPFIDPYMESVDIYAYGLGAEYPMYFISERIRYIFEIGYLSMTENYSDDVYLVNWVDTRFGFRFYF